MLPERDEERLKAFHGIDGIAVISHPSQAAGGARAGQQRRALCQRLKYVQLHFCHPAKG